MYEYNYCKPSIVTVLIAGRFRDIRGFDEEIYYFLGNQQHSTDI